MNYKLEVIRAMDLLAEDERVIFLGQNVIYAGAVAINESLAHVDVSRKIELPVFEDTQLGLSIGLALEGFVPVSIYPRMDFLVLALNQLVNHLDKIECMSAGRFRPKVIIRTCIGSSYPLDPGPQHRQDHTTALSCMLTNIDVIKLEKADAIFPAYQGALASRRSTVLVETADLMRTA